MGEGWIGGQTKRRKGRGEKGWEGQGGGGGLGSLRSPDHISFRTQWLLTAIIPGAPTLPAAEMVFAKGSETFSPGNENKSVA